ncbi:fibronectin type III domain-containing protein [Candidatus Aquiluna sp. UB-MaderosW2red]|uniref:fibronectin type III domain-containing protein n=1 Tax=Candidatus Aquiluna sp. UB-MaderosW2red TaxID=1855377 RepID=UPI00201D8C7D|nr:fibronectin type III domain-containing protein [Candidatus Aquiluna sp. UB-MaderosW2red]
MFKTNTLGAANILNTDLQTALTQGSILIESAGAITVSAAVTNSTANSNLTLNCAGSGAFTNSNGAISVGGALSVDCATITTSAALGAVGSVSLTSAGAASALTVGGNVIVTGAGNDLTLKSKFNILINSATLQTAGTSSGSGGGVIVWSDSDGNSTGFVQTTNSVCINTFGSCVTPVSTGGGDIIIGGGSTTDASGRYPTGGSQAGSASGQHGVRLGSAHAANGTKIWSGGGDLSLSSSTGTSAGIYGQYWYGGTSINAGNGQVRINNFAGATTTTQTYGLFLESINHPITVTSSKPDGQAIRIISSLANTGDRSQPILFWDGTGSIRKTISATGGGDVYMEGNASGTGASTYSFEISNADILASEGDITLKGNRGANFNSRDTNTLTSFGAVPSGSAKGDILFEGNRFKNQSTDWGLLIKTAGSLTVRPLAGESFTDAITFPRSEVSLIGLSGLTIGGIGNTQAITASTPSVSSTSIAGDVTFRGGAVTLNGNITASGNISAYGAAISQSGAFTSTEGDITLSGTGAISTGASATNTSTAGAVSITSSGSTVTTSGLISAKTGVTLETTSASSSLAVNGNVTVTGAGGDLLLKSKVNVVIDTAGIKLQTAGTASGSGGRIILWSDSDASGQGYITVDPNVTLNSIGGATTTYTGGGDIHLAGGLDNGSTAVSPASVNNDGLPDGWAIATDGQMGIWYGFGAASGNTNTIQSGGGDIRLFGKSTTAVDALAFHWTTRVDSGLGQIEIRADSAGWGLQLNRSGDADTYTNKSIFTSRSNISPAIGMYAKSTGGVDYIALTGSWADTGTDNLVIQSVGDGSVEIKADGPANNPALGLTSTAVLSKSGKITLDGGAGNAGIHFGALRSGHSQGQVHLGDCAVATCANSLVTSSSADVEVIGNRVTTFLTLGTTVSSLGALSILPAANSTAFTDFQGRTAGLTLASKLGGLQIGRPGDTTAAMTLSKNWTIAGPISVHAGDIVVASNIELVTTDEATSPIRFFTGGSIYTATGVDLTTTGSDVVYWTAVDKVAGTNRTASNIYIDPGTITTNGGKIWLAGGRDDGGLDALITTDRGKWSSVSARDGLPDGYAVGQNSANWDEMGVLINANSVLKSGGGDIFIAGAVAPAGGYNLGHIGIFPGVQIDSGTGRIAMWGRSLGSATNQGISLHVGNNGAPAIISSDAASADAISLYSDSSAGGAWSRGITALWYAAWDQKSGHQGVRILATKSGGGITLSGIGSSAGNDGSGIQGLRLGFIDILATDGPITLNGAAGPSSWAVGTSFGWENNSQEAVRLGAWTAGATNAVGGNRVTTAGGTQVDFATSSSDVTIHSDAVWMRQSGNGMWGVYVATTGDFKILPTTITGGLFTESANFKTTQNTTDWSFGKLQFPITPESIQIGRPTTTTPISIASNLEAHGAISVHGSALNIQGNVESKSGRGDVLFKSRSSIALAPNKKIETNGSNIVLWGGSADGNGYVLIDDGACVNTNASCDPAVSVSTGSIYMGGGSAGTSYPTGPVVDSGYRGVRLATSSLSRVKVLSGGGDIVMRGQSNLHGFESWQGSTIKATTGSITIEGTSTTAGNQGVRFATNSGTTLISSGKTSGTAIQILGKQTNPGTNTLSNAIYIGDSNSTIEATGGGDIVFSSDVVSAFDTRSVDLRSATVSANGGDILFDGDFADIISSNITGTSGSSIRIKSSSHIGLDSSTVQTSGPSGAKLGQISLWTDSDGDDAGVFRTSNAVCINTIASCSGTSETGGADIVIGGGSAAKGFFPAGGAPSTAGSQGVRLGSANAANQFKLWSGGGDITIRSKSATSTNLIQGQYWHGGTNMNSGSGAILVENIAGATGSMQSLGIDIRADGHPISVVSTKATGEAIKFVSALGTTNDYSTAILIYNGTNTVRTSISATGGGDIVMEGTAAGTANNTYSFDFSNADIIATSGNITLKGNRGLWLNRLGSGSSNIGATAAGSATGNISIEGNRFITDSTLPVNFKTTGKLTVKPMAGQSFIHPVTFPATGYTLTGLTGLQIGAADNTANLTVGQSATVAGPITYQGGVITVSNALTNNGAGPISLTSSSTVAQNADLASGVGGIYMKSVGKISVGPGASVAVPRKLSTAGGPITLWTTADNAGVDFSNYVLIETNANESDGADITIGGGSADPNNSARPAGSTLSTSGTALQIGGVSTNAENLVRVYSGVGAISMKAQTTHANAASSGINLSAGVKIVGNTIDLFGKAKGTSGTDNTASGIFHYEDLASAQTVIEATASYSTHTNALTMTSVLENGAYGSMLGNATGARSAQIAIITSGDMADMLLSGETLTGDYGFQTGGLLIATKTGNVVIDSKGKVVVFSRSGANRKVEFKPVAGPTGGDLTVYTSAVDSFSNGIMEIKTAGVVSILPPVGQTSFGAETTFPIPGSSIDVGGLIVGKVGNTANLVQGAAIKSSGDVRYFGGAQTANLAITTSNSGNIEFYPTTSFTKSTPSFNASGSILIGKSSSPASSVTLSTSTLTAGASVEVFSSGTITQTAALAASSGIQLESGTDVLVQANIGSGVGPALIKAKRHIVTAAGTSVSPLTISSLGQNITFQADSDGNEFGHAQIKNFNRLDTGTGGGDILISGGTDPASGFATSNNDGTGNIFGGVTLATTVDGTNPYFSNGIRITAGTGDVTIRGWSKGEQYGRGVIVPLSNDAANPTVISGRDISLVGKSTGASSWYGIELGKTSGNQAAQTTQNSITATRILSLLGTSDVYDGIVLVGNTKLSGGTMSLEGTGPRYPVMISLAQSAIDAGSGGVSILGVKSSASAGDLTLAASSFLSSGLVSIELRRASSNAVLDITGGIDSSSSNSNIEITSDFLNLGASINAGTARVTIEPLAPSQAITLGSEVAGTLALSTTELQRISAGTLAFNTDGNINVSASQNFTGKVSTLALRAGGNVNGSAGVGITVANLGIDAGGTINFPGNQSASVIALNASTVSYNQSANYSVATVDSIDPEFGYGLKMAVSNVPVTGTVDAFMAVTFNPPPTVTIRDKFGNTLATNNSSAGDYTVSTAFTVATTTSGTPVISGATATRSGGTFTFSDLKVVDGTGTGTFTFSATRNGTSLSQNSELVDGEAFTAQSTTTFTSASYNIQAGEPASIALSFASTSAQAGKTGLAPTATLKDVGGNTIASGPHANAAITISIAGLDGIIVSGATATTVNGVASFPNLVLGGKVNTDYTLTFSVTFQNTNTPPQSVTVTEDEVVTLTFGDASKVTLGAATQTVANRSNLANIVATIRDAYDNVVTDSTASVALTFGTGSTLAQSPVVTDYSAQNASSGVATFSGVSLAATVDSYTVTASSSTLATASQVVTVTHGQAHTITLTAPATATNDVVFGTQPVVRIFDQEGNLVTTGDQSTQTVTLSATEATLGGTVSMPAVAGEADFTGKLVKLTGTIGSITLKAAIASPNVIEETETITVGFGSATKLSITQAASGFVNRTDFTAQPKVTVQDISGNTVQNFVGTISLGIGSGAIITGSPSITLASPNSGVATFSGLGLQGTIGSYTITASSLNLTSATQTGVALTHGAAAKVVVTAPANAQSNVVFGTQPVARILDADDNLVTTESESTQVVTLTATGATLSGNNAQLLSMAAVAGEANFTGKGLKLEGELGTKTLTATISSPSPISGNASIELGFGEAVKLAITQAAAGFVNRTNFTTQPKVTVQDVSGNTVTNFTGEVELSIGSGAIITGDIDLTLVAGDLGVATFSGLGLQGTIGSYTITASSQDLTSATQTPVALTHGDATSVALTIPATVTNDAVFGVQPQARILDADGNLVSTGTQSTQDVVLSSSNATISGTLTQPALGGVADFTGIKLTSTIGSRSVTATISDPSAADTEATTVTFGSATKLAITHAAAGFVNRTNFSTQPKVTVQDISGNTVTNFTGDVALSIGSGASITGDIDLTLVAGDLGVATFSGLGIQGTIGSYTITASSAGRTSATQDITLTHGAAHSVVLTSPSTVTNNTVFATQPSVEILDRDLNRVTDGTQSTQTVTISSTADLSGTVSMPAVAGIANFSGKGLKLTDTIGSYTITATITSPEAIEDENNISISFGTATKLAITTPAAGFVNRTNFSTQPKVTVQDISGNTVTNFTGDVALSIGSGASITGDIDLTLVAGDLGVATFSGLGIQGTIGSYTITASSAGRTSATQDITLLHGAAHSVVLTSPATVTNDTVFATQPSVEILDRDLNRVTDGTQSTQTVTISSTADLSGTVSMPAVAGIANFSGKGLKLTDTIGSYTITATITSPEAIEDENNISISFGTATKLAITTPAAGFVNRTNFSTQPKVTVQDISGNTVTNFTGDVALSIAPPAGQTRVALITGITTLTLTAANEGVANFSGLGLQGTVGDYTITASSAGRTSATQDITLLHGAAVKLSVARATAGVRAGIDFVTQPQIEVLDQDDNRVTTGTAASLNVIASISGSGATISGTLTGQASVGLATFETLRVSGTAAGYQLNYQVFGPAELTSLTAAQESVTLLAGNPYDLLVTEQPAAIIAGEDFALDIKVSIRDQWLNTVLSDSTSTIKPTLVATDGTTVIDSSKAAVAATAGVVTFEDMTFTSAGNRKVLFALGGISELSDTFTITHAAASQIVWLSSEPTAMRNEISISPAPSFEIRDQFGNPATTGPRFAVTATVISSNSANVLATANTSQTLANNSANVVFAGLVLKAPAASYQLRFTATSGATSFSVVSAAIPLTFGSPTQLAITTPATVARAGLAFGGQPIIEIRDSAANLVSDSQLVVTASVAGRDLVGLPTKGAVNGVANFTASGLGISGAAAEGLTLVFSTEYPTGTFITKSQEIDVTAGQATLFRIVQNPTNLITRQTFSPVVEIELWDQFANKVETDSSSQVLVRLFTNTDSLALATTGQPPVTTISATANAGVVLFTGLGYAVAPGVDYYLEVDLNGYEQNSNDFEVLPGVATSIAIDTQPSTLTGSVLTKTGELLAAQPRVSVFDQDGYLATTTAGTVTVSATNTGSLSEGVTTALLENGSAQFAGVKLFGTPAQNGNPALNHELVFSFGSATVTSQSLNVTHNDAFQLSLLQPAADGRASEPFEQQPIIEIRDRYNNRVETGAGATLPVRVGTSGGAVSGANKNAVAGRATFTGLSQGGTVGTNYTLTFEVPEAPNVATTLQQNVQVSYGFAAGLRLAQAPLSIASGQLTKTGDDLATQPVIEVVDNWQNVVLDSSATVTASLLATLDARDRLVSASKQAVNGVATFSGLAMVVRPLQDYALKFNSGSLQFAQSAALQVRHGDATQLEITTQPVTYISDGVITKTGDRLEQTPIVRALDFDGNPATELNGDIVTATVTTGDGQADVAVHQNTLQHNQAVFINGIAQLQNLRVIALPQVDQKLTFTSQLTSPQVTITSPESSAFKLTFNDPYSVAVVTKPCAGVEVASVCQAGITGNNLLQQPVVEIRDRFQNRVTNYVGTVEVATSSVGSSILVSGVANPAAQVAPVSNGLASFEYLGVVATPGATTQFVFSSGTLFSATSQSFDVLAAEAAKLVMATQPVGARTGDLLPTQPVVHVLDRFNNRVLSDSSTVVSIQIDSGSGGTLTAAAPATLSATSVQGAATFAGLSVSGTPLAIYTLGFSAEGLTPATSAAFSVTNGLANGFAYLQDPAASKTGDLLTTMPELELLDAEGNRAVDDSTTVVAVSFAVTDGNARFVNSLDETVTPSMVVSEGVASFTGLRVVGTPGFEYKLLFTATPVTGPSYTAAASAAFSLIAANPYQLVLTQDSTGGLVGEVLTGQPVLQVKDRFNNNVDWDNQSVVTAAVFNDVSGSVVSGGSTTANQGVVTFSNIAVTGSPGAVYKLRFSSSHLGYAFSVDETVGYTLSKTAAISIRYQARSFVNGEIVTPTFATDSPATPRYTTSSLSSICELVLDPQTNEPNGQVFVRGVGDCVVTVTVPGVPFYFANTATATLSISKAQQKALVITSANNLDFWSTMTPAAAGGSGTGQLSFLVQGDCRIIGTTLIPGQAGSFCEVTARKLGDNNYLIAYSDPMVLTINKILQNPLRMASATSANMIDITLFTSGGSGDGLVTFAVTTNDSLCRIVDGNKLRANATGSCGVSATKLTSTNYLVAISPEQTVTFTKADQRVNFTSVIPATPLPQQLFTPVAVASSGLAVQYTITSGLGIICAWDTDPTKVKFLASGVCDITATQAGDGQFMQASAVQRIVVSARNQTIAFSPIAQKTYGDPGFFAAATASSGLQVQYSVTNIVGAPKCAVNTRGFITLLAAGGCEITASQPGNLEYLAATSVRQMFVISADLAGAPHLVSISAGKQNITASFNPPGYNGGATITAYRMVVTNADGDNFINAGCVVSAAPINCTLVGLPIDTYTVKVAAITVAGIGVYSESSLPIRTSNAPLGVTNLAAAPSPNTLTLNWDEPTAFDGNFEGYEVYVWPLGGDEPATPTATSMSTSASFSTSIVQAQSFRTSVFRAMTAPTAIDYSPAYEFKVVTITSESQTEGEENTTVGMQQSLTTPSAPTRLQLVELEGELVLGWSEPVFNGGSSLLGYKVLVNGAEPADCPASADRLCEYTEVLPGQTYEFAVSAENGLGFGQVATYSITIPAPPQTNSSFDGPMITKVTPNPARPGSTVKGIGVKLGTVTKIEIAGREMQFSATQDSITFILPANIADGVYDLVLHSSYGRLTIQEALTVSAIAVVVTDPETQPETDPDSGSGSGIGSGDSGTEGSGSNGSGSSNSGTDGSNGDGSAGDPDGSVTKPDEGSDSGVSGPESEPGSGGSDSGEERQGTDFAWLWIALILIALALVIFVRARKRSERIAG